MRIVVLGATLLAVVLPSHAGAQSLTLTEADALARLSTDSPRVRALRTGIDVARADALLAGRWPNPRVVFNRESVAGTTEHIVTLAQPLPISGRRGLEVQAASALVDAATSRSDDGVRRARADLRLAFAALVSVQVRLGALEAARTRLQEVVRILERREAAGDSAGFDRLRAEHELFDVDADLALATADRSHAQAALSGFFVGVQPAAIVAVAALSAPDVPPLAALLARAETTRGELVAFRQESAAARLAAEAADKRRIPEPEVIAGAKSSSNGAGDLGVVVSVQATVPIFDRGRPERAVAEARDRQAVARAEAFRQLLAAEIAGLRDAVLQRRDVAARYRDSAVRGTEQIERIARVSYEAGERGILELLDAYRAGASAAARQSTLDLAVKEAEIELEFASGWEMP